MYLRAVLNPSNRMLEVGAPSLYHPSVSCHPLLSGTKKKRAWRTSDNLGTTTHH
jgi:hypothetical protein